VRLMRIVVLLAIGLSHCIATSAFAQRGLLPPEEFDYPFTGPVRIQQVNSQNEVRQSCRIPLGQITALGCAKVVWGTCLIVKVSDEEIQSYGHDPDVFMRHEHGHCNGWPASHPGMR
jgi:hypothetical protein